MSGAARTLPQDYGDPFGATADPARYVPRDATERGLVELEQAVLDHETSALLVGVPGIGKTLLLRLLRRRLEARLQVIHLPYAALPPAALANWALNEMKVPSSWDPVGALATRAHHAYLEGRGGILLLVDDAEVMPEETARALAGMVRDAKRGLRFVAAVDEQGADRLAAWLDDVAWVQLVTPMTSAETFQYLHTRLHGTELPARVIEAFDPDTVARLHDRSGGIPGRLCAEASAVLLRALRPAATAATAESAAPAPETETDRLLEGLFRDAPEAPAAHPEAPVAVEAPQRPRQSVEAARPDGGPEETRPAEPEPGPPAGPQDGNPSPAPARQELALERAAGQLALAHSDVETSGDSAAFERAAGLLALAHQGDVEAGDIESTPGSGPDQRPRGRRRILALGGLFVLCFGVGTGVGLWAVRDRVLEPGRAIPPAAEPRPTPAPALPEAASAVRPAPPTPVRVQVNATPWARIRVDGVEVGVTPLAGLPLAPGPHTFEARFSDGSVLERVQEISPENRWVVFP